MTREQADEQLRKAIVDHAAAYEIFADGEVLDQFGIIAMWQQMNPTDEEDAGHRYTTQFHQNTVPDHVARGLFATALTFIDKE